MYQLVFINIIILFILYYILTLIPKCSYSSLENFNTIQHQEHNRLCFSNKMSEMETLIYKTMIKYINEIFVKYNITWMPVAGNLLAIFRHKQLFVPWDDDFDIVVREGQEYIATQVLKNELPKYGMDIVNLGRYDTGIIFKIHWKNPPEEFKKYIVPVTRNYINYSWPFIDLFLYTKNTISKYDFFHLESIKSDELPLKKIIIDDIPIYFPSHGARCYRSLLKNPAILEAREQIYSHKYKQDIRCIGDNRKILSIPSKKMIKSFLY